MKVVLAGLAPRDEVAFGIFLGRSLKTWSWEHATVVRGTALPEADVAVLDLAAAGLARATDQAQAELSRLLSRMPAVLLVPAHDLSWSAAQQAGADNQCPRVWLSKPYGTEDMRLALEKAMTPLPHGGNETVPQERRVTPVAAPAAPPAVAAAADLMMGLSTAEFESALADLPLTRRHLFLHKLLQQLALERPFEMRFTVQNSIIVHPADGWIASNTPMLVVKQVCQSDGLASVVTMREIDPIQAEERAHLLGMVLRELDLFLGELLDATQPQHQRRRISDRPH